MSNAKQLEMSLLTEHLNYTPLSLLDEIINTMNELTSHAVDAIENGMQAAHPADLGFKRRADAEGRTLEKDEEGNPAFPEAAVEIEDGANKLQTLLDANVDRNFDKLEIYVLRSVLSVPPDLVPWVKLTHYEDVTILDPSSSNLPTPESIQQLRRQLQETRRLHSVLNSRVAHNNDLIQQLRSLVSPPLSTIKRESPPPESKRRGSSQAGAYSFLAHTPSAQSLGVQPITSSTALLKTPGPIETNTSFTLSQLPALRSLLDELRPRLANIGATSNRNVFQSNAERERKLYIENQTRKVLERRGVAIGDSVADDLGRRIAPEERVALEEIVQGLDGGVGMTEH